jgi:hypothetical protein
MTDKNAKNQESVRKMAASMRTVFYLSLATNAYDVYRFMRAPGEVRQGIGIALGIIGTILLWQFSKALRAEKKQALYYWLAVGLLGYSRWIFIDATFDLNVLSVILLSFAVMLTLRMVFWMRNGALT